MTEELLDVFKKPEKIFVLGIGEVSEGQEVIIPEHNITLTNDGDIGIKCPSRTGKVSFYGGIPRYVAEVECGNANTLDAKIQCAKRWKSE
ncbi:MAG TPA: hypothetical protein VN174_03660 [Candidatus Methanoperedens sp.]|nr:hypothetical protein [Candidatus Methanoperedens sp.]